MIETTFTPVSAAVGGAMIGLGAVLLMALRGNVFGATGILAGVMSPSSSGEWAWRAVLMAGMISGPVAVFAVTGQMPAIEVPVSTWMLVVGGLIVGAGVTYGSGCTSGHGICGLARLSPRSIVATATFMASTAATVFVIRHVIGG
ncbi:YeeE/YedE family protein [Maritimibacter fusiformis]|uniref:YeeE/YedE family protein n=1 Tax=Maritimibacter fusiformis TaxID=2603819 RepID=A0A5D0RLL4_9RHOB|nr:YeeE/YedE thiosulfate transporter family protein [Maritimibacter fusiformis]TYB81444.1 YeeE/YedE family protein [Maritimibacter fusiformis]